MTQFRGTRNKIIQQWIQDYQKTTECDGCTKQQCEEAFSLLFDTIDSYSSYLEEDELFTILNQTYDFKNKLIISDAEYYVSLNKGTWILCSSIAGSIGGFNLILFTNLLEVYLDEKINGPIIKKLRAAFGESCIMLEAAKNRKKGIGADILKKYKGECGNANLKCHYNEDGLCKCSCDDVADICEKLSEDGLLTKKRRKYFYRDIV